MATKTKKKNGLKGIVAVLVVLALVAVVAMFVLLQPDTSGEKVGEGILDTDGTSHIRIISEDDLPDATTAVQTTNEVGDTEIILMGNDVTVNGGGAKFDGSTVHINRAGTYSISGTLDNGRILVRAKGEDVVLILNGVNVTCADSAPLYIHKANSVTVILNGNTENVFTDGSSYNYGWEYSSEVDGEPDACVFSKADLIIRGTGILKVNANFKNGIVSKDNMKIINTNVSVTAVNNGINGKDSLTVQNSTVEVNAGGDGLRSTKDNDAALGWADLIDSNIYITSAGDGIQTETAVSVTNCSMSIKTGNGSDSAVTDGTSCKGIKCNQGYAVINSGNIIFDTQDDAFNVVGDLTVNGGTMNIASGDDALHSDANIYVTDGMIVATTCNEGLESMTVNVSGGKIYINAKDDGINTAGGAGEEGFDGMAMMKPMANENNYVSISGGYIVISSQGDGIDSNGNIYMSDGTLIVNGPTSGADGAIDYDGDFYLDGGLLIATGSAMMAQAPDNLTQYCIAANLDKTVGEGTCICIEGGGESFVFSISKDIQNIVFSSPMLKEGTEYTISYGGKYSGGTVTDGICEGGSYRGGDELSKVTIEDYLTAYGSIGIGGSRGGQMFGNPGGFGGMDGEGKRPPEGGFGGQPPQGFGGGQPR